MSSERPAPGVIRVGTSGFSFADWKGPFYPKSLADAYQLPFYCNYFDTVELNSTYYRMPTLPLTNGLARKTPDGFTFVVKLHQSMTHSRDAAVSDFRAFMQALQPLQDSGRLGGLLAQFPWSFRFDSSNLAYILSLGDALEPHSLFVEFRHKDWLRDDVISALEGASAGYVTVDEPDLSGLVPPVEYVTSQRAYVRLHGRNAAAWWGGGSERYHYNYSTEELQEWVRKVRRMARNAAAVYVFFNNCHAGHAARNAMLMKRMLELPLPG